MKRYCTCCEQWLETSEFSKKYKDSEMLQNQCKECQKQKSRAWYQKNREYKLARNKKWIEENREKHNRIARKSHRKKREAMQLSKKESLY